MLYQVCALPARYGCTAAASSSAAPPAAIGKGSSTVAGEGGGGVNPEPGTAGRVSMHVPKGGDPARAGLPLWGLLTAEPSRAVLPPGVSGNWWSKPVTEVNNASDVAKLVAFKICLPVIES